MNTNKSLKNKIAKKIGQTISFYRNKRNFTQEELAEKIGADRTYISALEQGIKCASIYCLYLLAQELNIEFKELFDFKI